MPRKPREFVEGGLYHVYNRASHGTPVFLEQDAGQQFVEILRDVAIDDGHQVFAWVILSNHFHVVLRSSAVPLARTFGRIQSSFGRWRNRSLKTRGPTWQSRFKAKLVKDEGYLVQLIAYVHLNPVKAGLVRDPADYKLCGHREILEPSDDGLIARETALSLFGNTEAEAIHNYVSALAATERDDAGWLLSAPGRLPWWGRQVDRPLVQPDPVEWISVDGRPHREARPRLEASAFIAAACTVLGTSQSELTSRSRNRELTNLRFLVAALAIERWGQSAGDVAEVFGRRSDFVSWWAKRGRELRLSDDEWPERYETVDELLRCRFEGREGPHLSR